MLGRLTLLSNQKKSGKRRSTPFSESLVTDAVSLHREGRFVSLEKHMDRDAQEQFVEAWLSRLPEIEERRESRLARLRELLLEIGPAACVAYASLTYLGRDPNTYRESEDDRAAAHVEFLALQALPLIEDIEVAAPAVGALASQALQAVRDAFDDTAELITLRSVEAARRASSAATTTREEYRREALLESLLVRGKSYPEHTELILRGCLGPFDAECRAVLGFTADDAWRLVDAIGTVISPRVSPRLQAAHEQADKLLKAVKRARRKGGLPEELSALSPTQQHRMVRYSAFEKAFSEPLGLALLTAESLAEASGLEAEVCAAWLQTMTCPVTEYVDRFHHAPVGGHPVTRLPLLKVPGGYLAPVPSALPEALRPRMEDALRAVPAVWQRYEAARGDWLERISTKRLEEALPGSRSWTGVAWASSTDSSDLDGLVRCDDFALRLQCKAGRVSEAARRGAPSMVEDVQSVVADAVHQHARLTAGLLERGASGLGFNAEQADALGTGLTIEVVVTLDDITIWSTETHKLRQLVTLPDAEQVPWVLSLGDLLATTDLLTGAELAHFLTRRQRLEREARVEAHDELDWVGHYLKDGLFFDRYFDGANPPDRFRLMTFTEPIDTWYFSRAGMLKESVIRPNQGLPAGLLGLIRRLEHDRPRHWITAAIMLINGDEESRTLLADSLDHTNRRVAEVGWSNASQVFSTYGFTVWSDRRYSAPGLKTLLARFLDRKIEETDRPTWLALGLGNDNRLVIVLRETDPQFSVAQILLQREVAAEAAVSAEDA